MTIYRVVLERRAENALDALDRQTRLRISNALSRLAENPLTAPNVKALAHGGFRLRVGDYRILYNIDDEVLVILVVKVGHRRDVYRNR